MKCSLNTALLATVFFFLPLSLSQMNAYNKGICIKGYINIHLNDFRCLFICV